jgi:hypothetical protein
VAQPTRTYTRLDQRCEDPSITRKYAFGLPLHWSCWVLYENQPPGAVVLVGTVIHLPMRRLLGLLPSVRSSLTHAATGVHGQGSDRRWETAESALRAV